MVKVQGLAAIGNYLSTPFKGAWWAGNKLANPQYETPFKETEIGMTDEGFEHLAQMFHV